MKKHHNGAAAPGEASLDSQKMSLAPWAVLPFLTLPLSSGRRGGHRVLGDTGVAEESQKRLGGVWWEEGLGWAEWDSGWGGAGGSSAHHQGCSWEQLRAWWGLSGHSPVHPPQWHPEFTCSCRCSHGSIPLSALFYQSRALQAKFSAMNSGHFGKQRW